jgi:hypothetical protein
MELLKVFSERLPLIVPQKITIRFIHKSKTIYLYIFAEWSFFKKRFTMMKRMSELLCRIGKILLLAIVAVSAPEGIGRCSVSGYRTAKVQVSNVSLNKRELQNRKHKPVRVSRMAMSNDEAQLYRMLMDYRRQYGLPTIPVSPNLSRVARLHVRDLEAHPPSGSGNLHSWSEYGPWRPVCYRGGENVERMWSKPRELTSYHGNGYEIAAATTRQMQPDHALSLWEGSSAHNAVITNSGQWDRLHWHAVGLAISGSYAVVWFGEEPDNAKR